MNHILTNGTHQQVKNFATNCSGMLFATGSKGSTVFCLGEDKTTIETNLRVYAKTIAKEFKIRHYDVNEKLFHHIHRFYNQIWTERIGDKGGKKIVNTTNAYDVIKLTLGAGHCGVPAVFCNYYPVDTNNIAEYLVQPEITLRIPVILGKRGIFLTHEDNKGVVFLHGIKTESLTLIREHLDRLTGKSIETPAPSKVEKKHPDKDVMPKNINHATTLVDAISQSHTSHV